MRRHAYSITGTALRVNKLLSHLLLDDLPFFGNHVPHLQTTLSQLVCVFHIANSRGCTKELFLKTPLPRHMTLR